MKREVPEPWATAMRKAGVVDKRWGNPSWSELGRRVEAHASTLTAMADGTRRTSPETIAKVAEVLNLTPEVIVGWLGRRAAVGDLYDPPEESRLLSPEERDALTGLIRAMALTKEGAGHVAIPAQKMTEPTPIDSRRRPGQQTRAARKTTKPPPEK